MIQTFAVIKQQKDEICSLKTASIKLKLNNMSICLTATCTEGSRVRRKRQLEIQLHNTGSKEKLQGVIFVSYAYMHH